MILFGCNYSSVAQSLSDERPLLVSENGIRLHKDSVFYMTFRFRMQNRMGYFAPAEPGGSGSFEAAVRRLRLRFDGYVLNPKIGYYIQLSFSRNDQELTSGNIAQTVRDAMMYYTISDQLYFGFGQGKLPGNRERVGSSGSLQLPDRSIANSTFTLDRDFGFFVYYTQPLGRVQQLILKGAVSTGEGRGQITSNSGLAWAGRMEWLPLGTFTGLGDYSEGDNAFEPSPKLSLAVSHSANFQAVRSGGQLGSFLPVPVDIHTTIADMMFKYNGWGIMAEYFYRTIGDYFKTDLTEPIMRSIPRGHAFNIQLSRMIGRQHEVVARFAGVEPRNDANADYIQYRYRTKALGYNYYLNKHRVKFQYYIALDDREYPGIFTPASPAFTNRFSTMVQIELGI